MNIEKLKLKILDLAIRGKLVPQDPNDEPASVLIEKIRKEKEELIKQGKIKRDKNESYIYKGSDNCYYEKMGNQLENITNQLPIENLPIGWIWTKLTNIAFVTKLAGFEYTSTINPNLTETGIPLFKGKNVQNGVLIEEFESYIPEDISDSLPRSQLNKKALLVPYVGTIGNIAIFNGNYKAHLGSNVGKIEIYNTEITNIYEEYILYYLMSSYGIKELTKHKKATAQESISIDAIRDVYIPIPPLNEQEKIIKKIKICIENINNIIIEKKNLSNIIDICKRKILDYFFSEQSCYKSYYEKVGNLIHPISTIKKEINIKMIKEIGKYPVISQSSKNIDGYSDDITKVIFDIPVILFGDHTKIVKYIDFPFVPGANGTKLFKTDNNYKYMFYLIEYAAHKISNRGYGRHYALLKNHSVSFVNDYAKQEQIVPQIEIKLNFLNIIKEQLI